MRSSIIIAASLLTLACGIDRDEMNPSRSTTAATTDPAPRSALDPVAPAEKDEPSSRPGAVEASHEVHLVEYQIHMPQTLPSGRNVFAIENAGKEKHAFEIEGQGIEKESEVLSRGGTTQLEVNLEPGTYTVYCPVNDHAEKGMRTTVTVR